MRGALQIRPYEPSDEDDVVALWEMVFPEEPPWNESRSLVQQKLTTQPELFFVCVEDGILLGTSSPDTMAFAAGSTRSPPTRIIGDEA